MGNFPPEPDGRGGTFAAAAVVIAAFAFAFGAVIGYALGLVRG